MTHPVRFGIVSLMQTAFAGGSLELMASELLGRMLVDPNDACAAIDLATIFELGGDPALALEFQDTALELQQVYREHDAKASSPVRVLAIKSRGAIMDNMPIEFLLESPFIQLDSLYVGHGIPTPTEIPEHDVAMVAICESDFNQPLLHDLSDILAQWPRPVLNSPASIANLSRERLGALVQNMNGLVFASSVRFGRSELDCDTMMDLLPNQFRSQQGWIIRPVNSHAGHGLERFADRDSLLNYLSKNSGAEFLVAPFVPYASADGVYRKYRVAIVQGESYPVHMALSDRWMVHYLNADMLHRADHRDEEAEFMRNFGTTFGRKHKNALNALADRIGLEYVVIDCAETIDGELLLFEADNGAVVHSMDPVDMFAYKRPAMQKIFAAFTSMIIDITHRNQTLAA